MNITCSPAGGAGTIPSSQAAPSAQRIMTSVAIVEDSTSMRKSLVELVNSARGYRCVCDCANAREALIEVPKHHPDVVLMDIHMPGESGIVCTARLTAQMPQLQVIILTVYNDTRMIFEALKAGACGYVLKRSKPEEILEAIAQVRSGGAPMTGEIARMVVRSFKARQPSSSEKESLSGREMEILVLLTEGLSNKEIASRLEIGTGTVRSHISHIFEKLHVR